MALGQDPPNANISWRIYVGTIVSIVPATTSVILRFVARNISRAGLWWDDYTIAVSLVVNWGMAALRWAQIPLYDYGHHAQYITPEKLIGFGKSFVAVQLLYFTNAVLTKTSLLFLFYRIFGVVRGFRWVLWASGFMVVAYFIVCSITSIVGCSPVSKAWNTSEPGHCINEVAFFRWNGIGNMILDFLVLCLPLPMAWRVKTTIRQKCILSGIFLLGGFVCIVSIMRIISFESAVIGDPTYTSIGPATWSSVEQSVGIICACLPTLRPLFRRLYGVSRVASSRSMSPTLDSQDRSSLSRRMSHCDEESRIIRLGSPQQYNRRTSSHELDGICVYGSPTFDETQEHPDSQVSQTNGVGRPVSATRSLG
ncbi:uncharacterized protein N7500_009712 [Penicillium coprophilum]|uniref:uncharacterized protein n=1 Tax=Penicillium coprophilum TaxID=36646 RepID=UPI0023A634DE|nr:uncharacterized protein N7500_009712 [Penicillium coprophilum]KAJ5154273.1 hypothetical protein N7500_009712 [Penicillium coprophilum]